MRSRCALLVVLFIACAAPALVAQTATAQMVTFRIKLTLSADNRQQAGSSAQPGVNAQERSGPGVAYVTGAGTTMQIRIQVIDENGSTLGEQSPDSEGSATFEVVGQIQKGNVRIYPTYRVRVFGPEIEEVWAEGVEPGRSDRMLMMQVRRKGEKPATAKDKSMVSASALKIPRKAQKELDAGNEALGNGKLDKAREHFDRATQIYPQFDQAWNNLGVVRMKQGDRAGGQQAFEAALKINDKFARAYVNLARLALQDNDYKQASELLKKSLSTEPLNAEALSMACQADFLAGNLEQVVSNARKLHTIPHDGQALGHYAAGSALQQLNRPSEAITEYTLFLKEAPQSPLTLKAREAISELGKQVQVESH
ncbi:MAG TPA: tetratricopeptide repeat protein [Clostridia bacterium]|nr:tetratricopeptide repeat protein [Clostridia bacterium]